MPADFLLKLGLFSMSSGLAIMATKMMIDSKDVELVVGNGLAAVGSAIIAGACVGELLYRP